MIAFGRGNVSACEEQDMTSLQKRTAETPRAQRTLQTNQVWMHGAACECVTAMGSAAANAAPQR